MAIITFEEFHRPEEARALAQQALALDPKVEGADVLRRMLGPGGVK